MTSLTWSRNFERFILIKLMECFSNSEPLYYFNVINFHISTFIMRILGTNESAIVKDFNSS